jgi:uncharacterized protein RhaS with RHS repeats
MGWSVACPFATLHSTQEDPIGLAGGLNLYGYGEGDPVNNSDPFGLCPIPTPLCLAIVGAEAGAAAGTIVPGVGNVVGALAGAAGGLIAAWVIGDVINDGIDVVMESRRKKSDPPLVPSKTGADRENAHKPKGTGKSGHDKHTGRHGPRWRPLNPNKKGNPASSTDPTISDERNERTNANP